MVVRMWRLVRVVGAGALKERRTARLPWVCCICCSRAMPIEALPRPRSRVLPSSSGKYTASVGRAICWEFSGVGATCEQGRTRW